MSNFSLGASSRRDFLLRAAVGAVPCAACFLGVKMRFIVADDKSPVTDESKADADFHVQGEYDGEIVFGVSEKIGVQVIALGGGKFHAVAYEGGLPGTGWHRMADNTEADGETKERLTILGDNNNPAAWRIWVPTGLEPVKMFKLG